MKLELMGLAGVALAGGVWASGVFEAGEYYERSPKEVMGMLNGMNVPAEFVRETPGKGLYLTTDSATTEQVDWTLKFAGNEIADVTANLSPSGDGTRVEVGFEFHEFEEFKGLENSKMIGEIGKMAITEQIDATLEGRPFDQDAVMMAIASHAVANPGEVMKMSREMNESINGRLDELRGSSEGYGSTGDSSPQSFGSERDYGYGLPTDSGLNDYEDDEDGGWGE